MSRVCEICHKGPLRGYNVSHAHNRTKKVSLPNLQKVRILEPSGRVQQGKGLHPLHQGPANFKGPVIEPTCGAGKSAVGAPGRNQ